MVHNLARTPTWAESPQPHFSIEQRMPNGAWRIATHPAGTEAQAFAAMAGQVDVYTSTGRFSGRRLKSNWLYSESGHLDLDHYSLPHDPLAGLSDSSLVFRLQWHCLEEGFPAPSRIVASGGGHYLFWDWTRPVTDLDLLERFNRLAVLVFAELGADPVAFDVTRLLRVPGTLNRKNGNLVRVIHDCGPKHDFESIVAEYKLRQGDVVLPGRTSVDSFVSHAAPQVSVQGEICPLAEVRLIDTARRRKEAARTKRKAKNKQVRASASIQWWRNSALDDLVAVTRSRVERDPNWRAAGGIPPGLRDQLMVPIHALLAWEVPVEGLEGAVRAFGRLVVDPEWLEAEWIGQRFHGACQRRAEDAAQGLTRPYTLPDGRVIELDPRYRYRASTIIGIWGITPEEMRGLNLKGLVSREEARRRENEKRRTVGRKDRPKSQPTGKDRGAWLSENSVSATKPWEAEGLSRATWYRRKKNTQATR